MNFCPASTFWGNGRPHDFTDDETTKTIKEQACKTLALCILTTLNKGLRNGGGIGDVLRPPSVEVRYFFIYLKVIFKVSNYKHLYLSKLKFHYTRSYGFIVVQTNE